jgi:hypothetical protein
MAKKKDTPKTQPTTDESSTELRDEEQEFALELQEQEEHANAAAARFAKANLADDGSDVVLMDSHHRKDINYVHAVLCQVGLPRRKVGGSVFSRTHKGASILVEAGRLWDGRAWVEQFVPYGPKPRLMLADLFTYAVTHRTKVIPVEDNVTSYLARLGFSKQGGSQGPLTLFRRQALALSACRMSLGITYGKHAHTLPNETPFERFSAWLDDHGGQRTMWPAEIELTEKFYRSLIDHAVPLDACALATLSGSALALDVYTWLAYRLHQLARPTFLPWKPLREQFGQEYSGTNGPQTFKRDFLKAFHQVTSVYPESAKSEHVNGGLRLVPAPPPIRPTQVWFRRGLKPIEGTGPHAPLWDAVVNSIKPDDEKS